MFERTKAFFTDGFLLRKLFIVIIGLIVFRIFTTIPLPYVNAGAISSLLAENQILGVFNLFSGGGLSNFSIAMLGVFPYITVAILVQLLTAVFPALHSLYHEEGEAGRKKVGQWTRIATVPVATLNAVGILLYFMSQQIIPELALPDFSMAVLFIVTGSMLSLWVGELVTEFGIGNGISLIIFAGIVVNIPSLISQVSISYSPDLLPIYILIAIGIFIFVAIAIWMNEAERPIPVTYARYGVGYGSQERRADTYIPMKVNPVGVLSIIFALTVAAAFAFLARFMSGSEVALLASIGSAVDEFLANGRLYAIPVAILTIFFTYFHAPIVLNTKKIADNLQSQGAFVPGLRPGEETIAHFDKVLFRVLFYAVVFLTIISIVPYLVTGSTAGTFLFAIGGTGLMIVVSVLLDLYRKVAARINDKLHYAE